MVTNPYKILDIPETATDEEVKSAYRKLAKKYHPDKYVDSPLKDVADEKMKEINEAYDMIMDMGAVHVGCNNKCVSSLREPHACFISNSVRFLWCNFTRLKGLADLVGNHISFRLSTGYTKIFFFRLIKFQINQFRTAFVRRNIFSILSLFPVLRIVRSILQALLHCASFILMHCD